MADYPDSKTSGNKATVNFPVDEIVIAAPGHALQGIELVTFGEMPSEPEKSRSKLRIIGILLGLYVSSSSPDLASYPLQSFN